MRCRIFVVYRAPKTSQMPRLIDCLYKFTDVKYNCIIAGDLNCADIDWLSLRAPTDGTQDLLLNFAVARGFTQVVERPTIEKIIY